VTFQAVLTEGSNEVRFQYKNVALGPANPARNAGRATVGVRNTGAPANQQQIAWSYNVPVVAEESALQFSTLPTAACVASVTASVTIDRDEIAYNPGIQPIHTDRARDEHVGAAITYTPVVLAGAGDR